MERLEFNDYEEFACEVADTFDDICKNDDFDDIAIIAHYDEAKQIIREILCLGYDLNSIELKNPELGYDDVPYVISVCGIDSEYEVWCESMVRDNGEYIDDESSIIYVLDNCSSEVLKHLDSECVFEVGIGEDECSCDECDCNECDKGFTVNGRPVSKEEFDNYTSHFIHDEKPVATSTATYRVNGKEVDKDTFESALSDIEDRYLDNVRDMLLGYCEIMDEMNEWRRLLGWQCELNNIVWKELMVDLVGCRLFLFEKENI